MEPLFIRPWDRLKTLHILGMGIIRFPLSDILHSNVKNSITHIKGRMFMENRSLSKVIGQLFSISSPYIQVKRLAMIAEQAHWSVLLDNRGTVMDERRAG